MNRLRTGDQCSIPGWGRKFSVCCGVQEVCGGHAACRAVCTEKLSPGVKPPVREADHSLPLGDEVKKAWNVLSTGTTSPFYWKL